MPSHPMIETRTADEITVQLILDAIMASCKATMVYRDIVPNADEGECWAEFTALSDSAIDLLLNLPEATAAAFERHTGDTPAQFATDIRVRPA